MIFVFGRGALSAVLTLILSAYPVTAAESGSAIMSPNGPVTLNGTTTSQTSAISSGDKLSTGENSTAAISSKGLMLGLSSGAAVTYRGKRVEIGSGTVTVSTTSSFSALVNGYSAAPVTASAKYQIVNRGHCASLTVENGAVVASKGRLRNVVAEGKSIALDDYRCGFGRGPVGAGAAVGVASTIIVIKKTPSHSSASAP